jgi:predicted nucleic acid-binding protein
MPVLNYLVDTNAVSDLLRGEQPVIDWFSQHPHEIGISTLTLAEMRWGIEKKVEGKRRRELERKFRYVLEDYRGAIFVFDEAAAMEWGRLMAEARGHPVPLSFAKQLTTPRVRGLRPHRCERSQAREHSPPKAMAQSGRACPFHKLLPRSCSYRVKITAPVPD